MRFNQGYFPHPRAYSLLLVLALLTFGAGLRLYDLTDQPIDFHSTRQLRGAIIARGMYYEMNPSADPAARQQAIAYWQSTGQYEPSILERLVALTYLLIGGEKIWLARLYNTLFWTVGGVFLFSLAYRMAAPARDRASEPFAKAIAYFTALLSLAYYLVLPFSVQASRSFQPDPGMVMWIILSAYLLFRWSEDPKWLWALLAGTACGMAVLSKVVAFYIVFGAIAAIVLYTHGFLRGRSILSPLKKILLDPQVWAILLLMIAPTILYYLGRGGRASEYFSSWTIALAHLLLEPRLYIRWANLAQELVGLVALIAAIAGVFVAKQRNLALLVGLWLGYIVYGFFLPYQISTHSYYHIQLIPIVALSLVPITQVILVRIFRMSLIWRYLFAGLAVLTILYASWQALIPLRAEDYRGEPAYWQTIAAYMPADGKILALTQDYGYRLMYYGWRKVVLWPNRGEQELNKLRGSQKDFEAYFKKRSQDKRYFLVTAFKQFEDQPMLKQYLYDSYPVLAEGPAYIIFDLAQPFQPPAGAP